MTKTSSGDQFVIIKIMLWPAAKGTGTNTECDFYLFLWGMQSQVQQVFFQIFLNKNIGLHHNAVNYDLNSLLPHLSWNQQNYATKEFGPS